MPRDVARPLETFGLFDDELAAIDVLIIEDVEKKTFVEKSVIVAYKSGGRMYYATMDSTGFADKIYPDTKEVRTFLLLGGYKHKFDGN